MKKQTGKTVRQQDHKLMKTFGITEKDRQYAQMYREFLPEKVIDAHMHLWAEGTVPSYFGKSELFFRPFCTAASYREDMKEMLPGVRELGMLAMPMPDAAQADRTNGLRGRADRFLGEQKKAGETENVIPCIAAAPLILPSDTEEEIGEQLDACGGSAIKVYGTGTGKQDIAETELAEFLPESAWVVAQQRKMPIILHLLKRNSLSDPENLRYLNRMTAKYPEAPLVLAHCARSFVSWTGMKQIRDLADTGNIWFDLSAICEPGPMMACILKNAGKRTMWGSDYPNCMWHGRAVTVGMGQNWLLDTDDDNKVLLGEENLMAFYQAALLLDLDKTQIEDIFYNNAKRLYFKT